MASKLDRANEVSKAKGVIAREVLKTSEIEIEFEELPDWEYFSALYGECVDAVYQETPHAE